MNITLDGQEFIIDNPKAKAWRMIAKFETIRKDIPLENYTDFFAEVIVQIIDNPEITVELILTNIGIENIIAFYDKLACWIFSIINKKLSEVPPLPKDPDGPNTENFTEYEKVVYFYSNIHEGYGWTRRQIDEEDLGYLLDLIIVRAKANCKDDDKSYIDEETGERLYYIDAL